MRNRFPDRRRPRGETTPRYSRIAAVLYFAAIAGCGTAPAARPERTIEVGGAEPPRIAQVATAPETDELDTSAVTAAGSTCPEPAPRAIAPASLPVQTLAPLWRRARVRTTAELRTGLLLGERSSGRFELVIGEGRRPGEAAVLRSYFPEQVAVDAPTGRVTAARPALIGHALSRAADTIVMLDDQPGTFGTRQIPSGQRGWQGGAPAYGYRLYGSPRSIIEWATGALSARDVMSGAVRWTRALGDARAWSSEQYPEPLWLETPERFFVRTATSLDALDPITGCVFWSVQLSEELAGSVPMAADDRHLVVRETLGRLAVYDARDGTRLRAFDDPFGGPWYGDRYNGAAILGDVFVAWRSLGAAHAMTLDGEGLWSREGIVWAEAAEDAVFTGTCDHAIHAIEPISGDVAWSYFVDGSSDPCHDPWDREWTAFVVTGLNGGPGLAVSTDRESLVLARTGQVWPARATTIEGTVRVDGRPVAGATVRVGDHAAVTDGAGRFSAALTGHGDATVRADAEELSRLTEDWPVRSRVRFEGHGGCGGWVFPTNGVGLAPLDGHRTTVRVALTFERGPLECPPIGQ
jgi:hypothetical protein